MSDGKKSASGSEEDFLLDLNFVPQWAKKSPQANHYSAEHHEERRHEPRGAGRRERREGDRPRPPRRESGERPPQRFRPRRDEEAPAIRRAESAPVVRREEPLRPERVELPIDIKFLPEQQMLASMVRQIHHSKRAYPLMDLSNLFLADVKGHQVKLEVRSGTEGFKLYQGKRSRMVATSREVLIRQLADEYLGEFFTRQEIDVDPPSGVFPVIGKIGDLLIGPPNHHSYAARLQEIHSTRFAGMSQDRFKEKIEIVRDEALVERWKQESSRQVVYRLKDQPEGGREFSLIQAEEYVRTHIADLEIEEVGRAVLPSETARKIKDYNLLRMVREAWERESRFPMSVSFALRAAFRHLHLHLFKAGGNINFVTAVKPDPIAPEKAVETIRLVLEYLADHPGSTREQLVAGLRPDADPASPEAHEIINPLRWLVEKGHIIEFFNGTLAVPSHRRRR